MNLTRNQTIIIGIAFVFVCVIVLLFTGVLPGLQPTTTTKTNVSLTAMGTLSQSDFQNLIDSYEKTHNNVKITYTQVNEANYENAVLSSLASGNGPDILMFKNTWLPKHIDKIVPAPSAQFSLNQLQNLFPKVVEQDFTYKGNVYALPLYIDTLALIYNKDTFDAKAIALVPNTWTGIQNIIPQVREINDQDQIVKPAAAIGGSAQSINNASDLLNQIFMQFGNPYLDSNGSLKFDANGQDAFNFYLQFANSASKFYTWTDNFAYSLDSFSSGNTAMIFNYESAIQAIKSKNQYLNYGIAPMPQIDAAKPVNFANYWGLAVSKLSANPAWAWDFITAVTTDQTISDDFLKAVNEPPALRTLINKYLSDPTLNVFAAQALTARSWPEADENYVASTFSGAINSVLIGKLTSLQAFAQIKNNLER